MSKVRLSKIRILRNKFKTIVGVEINDQRVPFAGQISISGSVSDPGLSKVNLTIPTNDVEFVDLETESAILTHESEM